MKKILYPLAALIAMKGDMQCPEKVPEKAMVETCRQVINGVTNIVFTEDGDTSICRLLDREL